LLKNPDEAENRGKLEGRGKQSAPQLLRTGELVTLGKGGRKMHASRTCEQSGHAYKRRDA